MPDQSSPELCDLTDEQLQRYRAELAHSLKGLAPSAPVRDLLRRKLVLIVAEQDARRRTA